jgi:hypothetical protein
VDAPILFIDVPRPGSDPRAVGQALNIDAYRARMLAIAGAPFVWQGFQSQEAASRAAAFLCEAGFPASAHSNDRVVALPSCTDAVAFQSDATSWRFLLAGGETRTIEPAALRCLVQGKLTVEVPGGVEPAPRRLPISRGIGMLAGLGVSSSAVATVRHNLSRLELFLVDPAGPVVRIGLRHDRFDFTSLLERKTLSAIRNLDVMREILARRSDGAAVDETFHRTVMSRSDLVADAWIESDLGLPSGGRAADALPARSNRVAFDLFARLRFLHELSRRAAPPRAAKSDHFYEL